MSNIGIWVKNLGGVIVKNGPSVLTGIAGIGLVSTAIFAGTGAIKAYQLVGLEEIRLMNSPAESGRWGFLSTKETIRVTWKCYIPAFVTGAITLVCIIGANKMNLQRNAALVGLYSFTETAFKEYKNKVVDTLGRAKEEKIRDDISADTIKANPSSDRVIISTRNGNVLCYDKPSDRYFRSDVEKIRQIRNEINRKLRSEDFISLNEFYSELDLEYVSLGYDNGWNIDKGYLDISFSAQLDKNDEPCIVLNYEVVPRYV